MIALRAEESHTNHRGTVMGGMLATLVDLTLGLAVATPNARSGPMAGRWCEHGRCGPAEAAGLHGGSAAAV